MEKRTPPMVAAKVDETPAATEAARTYDSDKGHMGYEPPPLGSAGIQVVSSRGRGHAQLTPSTIP